jgi:GNAT superfamily N-acetyltransferase
VKRAPAFDDFNALFQGKTYGSRPIFTRRSFGEFVAAHELDLARAVTRIHDGALVGALAFAIRGERAWFALIGVSEAHRGAGLGASMVAEAIACVRAAGAASIELETVTRNAAAMQLVLRQGFENAGELQTWTRKPSRHAAAAPRARSYSRADVERIAVAPPACWQREPRSVAAVPRLTFVKTPGAYAFVRIRDGYGMVLDAGARDDGAAQALLRELDTRIAPDLTLNNEPVDSPLSRALATGGWKIIERQHRLRTKLRSSG